MLWIELNQSVLVRYLAGMGLFSFSSSHLLVALKVERVREREREIDRKRERDEEGKQLCDEFTLCWVLLLCCRSQFCWQDSRSLFPFSWDSQHSPPTTMPASKWCWCWVLPYTHLAMMTVFFSRSKRGISGKSGDSLDIWSSMVSISWRENKYEYKCTVQIL